jgi:hypothetical protein
VRECVEQIVSFPLSPALVGLNQLERTDLDRKLPLRRTLINRDPSVTGNAYPKHSKCIIQERITKRDAGQNFITSQITLEERAMAQLREEIENFRERPTDSDF